MNAPRTESVQSRLETLIALARLLERVEASPVAVGADQYRSLVDRIKGALAAPLPPAPLPEVAAPEGELNWTAYLSWSPAGELAFLPGVDSWVQPRGVAAVVSSASTVTHEPLETRK